MKRPPLNFTRRLRSDLARVASLVPALSLPAFAKATAGKPAGVLILPSPLGEFQSFVNKVHHKAGPRR